MEKQIDARAVQAVLYGIYKALYSVAGASSAAVMRRAAPDILEAMGMFGIELASVNSIERLQDVLSEAMVASGCCESMDFELKGDKLACNITGCSFYELTAALKEKDIPPFGCPFAALTLGLADKSLNMRGRVTHLAPTAGGNPGDTSLVVELHEK